MSVTNAFVIVSGLLSVLAFRNPALLYKLIGWPHRSSTEREYYRLFTGGLVHGDYIHLLVNLFVMHEFGAIVEMEYKVLFGENGVYYFLALIVLGVIVPNLFDLMLHKNQPNYRSLGASGSVSAVLFAYVLFNPWSKLYVYCILPLYSIVAAVLYIVYSVYQDKKGKDNINHMAHLIGAVFGFVFTLALKPSLGPFFVQQLLSFSF